MISIGLGLTSNEQEFMESAVSMPFSQTAMFAESTKNLDDIADQIVGYMCNGNIIYFNTTSTFHC